MSFAGKLYSRVLQLAVDRMLREWWRHQTNPLNALQKRASLESADFIAEGQAG